MVFLKSADWLAKLAILANFHLSKHFFGQKMLKILLILDRPEVARTSKFWSECVHWIQKIPLDIPNAIIHTIGPNL